ncbi:MAG: AMP-binding protein, partial [Proteobacteria bacterium]|nr:AMP-binding protein [Pseudomonadota bacterium]
MSEITEFLAARDFLLQHRSDYAAAYAGFKWPRLEHFNWALDYFDAMARNNDAPALWLVEQDGSDARLSFAELSARSSQVANWLREQGVQRGDRILIMLGNEVPLWETMLAAF